MTSDVDLLVVGGGPVGLAASIEARLAGLTVAVIEPRDGAIDKACGEGLMPGALPLLARLGVDPDGMPLFGVSYRNGRIRADHRFRDGVGRGVRRTTLHAALAHRAAALGVERVDGKVDTIDQDAAGVWVRGIRGTRDGERSEGALGARESSDLFGIDRSAVGDRVSIEDRAIEGRAIGGRAIGDRALGDRAIGAGRFELRASWILGCDGLHSTVRRLVGLERAVPARGRRFGVRQHFFVEPWNDLIEVHWSEHAEAYVTPVSANVVGIAMLGAPRTDFAETLAAIPELAARVRGAEPASSLRGAGPFRQRAATQLAGRVLLLGDASGYVDAITGEGLRLGFDQARAAVVAVVNDRVPDYPREWRRVTRDFRVLTAGLVAAANGPFRSGIVPTARRMPRLYGSIVERLAR